MDKIALEVKDGVFQLYINGFIHLMFKLSELKAIQSWKEEKGLWSIEYYLKDCRVLTEYDRRERWEIILKILDNACLLQLDKP